MDIAKRLGFLGLTCFGFVSIIPNGMMCDSGTKESIRCARRGILASCLFMTSGIIGTFHKNPKMLLTANRLGLVGFCLQLSAFIVI